MEYLHYPVTPFVATIPKMAAVESNRPVSRVESPGFRVRIPRLSFFQGIEISNLTERMDETPQKIVAIRIVARFSEKCNCSRVNLIGDKPDFRRFRGDVVVRLSRM
jgi:hypothetical protein